MTWKLRIDVEDDSAPNESRWRGRLTVMGAIVGVTLWLVGVAALVVWLAQRIAG